METVKSNESLAHLRHFNEKYLPQIEKSLREFSPVSPPKIEKEFNESLEFALFSEGKRVRAILTLLGAELFGGKAESVLPSAAAVEFIHTSSKIFNELYFTKEHFENSLREKSGDSMAVLVALGLLNSSYSLVFVNHIGMPERAMQAHAELVECIGASGLIGGKKSEDFNGNSNENFDDSILIRLAFRLGAILSGADYLDLANLSRFAGVFSEAYQISESLENNNYLTNTTHLNNLVEEGKRLLIENFPSNEARSCLIQLTEYLMEK